MRCMCTVESASSCIRVHQRSLQLFGWKFPPTSHSPHIVTPSITSITLSEMSEMTQSHTTPSATNGDRLERCVVTNYIVENCQNQKP